MLIHARALPGLARLIPQYWKSQTHALHMPSGGQTALIFNGAIIICGSAVLAATPFVSKRVRARWANGLLITVGIVGMISYTGILAIRSHWLVISPANIYKIQSLNFLIDGWVAGVLTALLVSGQIQGKKIRDEHKVG